MKNKIKYFVLAITISSLVFPKPALAVIGTGIFDYFETALGGVEEIVGPIGGKLILFFLVYVVGIASLYTSANLLQFATEHPEWLSLSQNAMVRSGWAFTSGIANIFIILILIIIALAYILKLETFQAKRAFPRLLMVALLVNFSLVFVGALVDISNIAYNTVLSGSEGLPIQIIDSLGVGGWGLLQNLMWWLVALAASFLIPFVGPFAQYALVIGVISIIFLPNIVTWVVQIFLFFSISSIFFLYAFLFAARVFIVQILAILAPLAFLCFILPQTQKYWTEWLHHLVQWTFFGVVLFFFLVLGLRATNWLIPPYGTVPTPIFGWLNISEYFIYYFFLFVYLVVIAGWISTRFMPTLASALIAQGQAVTGMVWTRGIRPLGTAARRQERETRAGLIEKSPRLKALGERWAKDKSPELKGWKILAAPVTLPAWAMRRVIGRGLSVTPLEEERKKISRVEGEAEKIKDPTLLLSRFRDAMGIRDLATAIGYLSQAVKKGSVFRKLATEEVSEEKAVALAQRANQLGAVPEAERIAQAFLHKLPEAEADREAKLQEMGFKAYAGLDPDEQREWDAKGYTTITHKLVGEATGDEVKNFAKGFWENDAMMWAVQKFWGGPQLRRAAEEFGRGFADSFMEPLRTRLEQIRNLEATDPDAAAEEFKNMVHVNTRKALYLGTTAAQELGFESLYDAAPAIIKQDPRYKSIKDVVAERP